MNQNEEYEDMPVEEKKKKQELLDDLPDYEVLGLADDEIDLQPALDLLAQRNREE